MSRISCLLLALLFFHVDLLQAENLISTFGAEVIVERSGDAVFTETIGTTLQGKENYGITRTLPRRVIGADGRMHRILREVNFVFRGSEPVLYKHDLENDADVLRIGNRDMRIKAGEHIFTVQYVAKGLVSKGKNGQGFKIAVPGRWDWPVVTTQIMIKFANPALRNTAEVEVRPLIRGGKRDDGRPLLVEKHDYGFLVQYPKALKPGDTLWLSVLFPR